MIKTDVCIVGAGPGGVAAALRLSYMNIPCVIVDKATFPRDKICGDAISGKVITLCNRMDKSIIERFNTQPIQSDVWGLKVVAPNKKELLIPFKPGYMRNPIKAPGYVSKRIDFDNFLIEELKSKPLVQLYEGIEVTFYEKNKEGYLVSDATGNFRVMTKLLIVADGAQSAFSRKHAGLEKDPKHFAGAVRAYYKGVTDFAKDNFIELHFPREIMPGYFWIFPLPDGMANVGIGMRTDHIKKRKINLRQKMIDIVENAPGIKERFKNAEMVGKIEGYGLPLGSKLQPISGDHYLLVGDAGYLIDPLTGEGIGNAFYSGYLAAEQIEKSLAENNFSAAFLKTYDARIKKVLGSDMKLSYQLQRLLSYPRLTNIFAHIISGNQVALEYFSKMIEDFDVRKQIINPLFWAKIWRKKKR